MTKKKKKLGDLGAESAPSKLPIAYTLVKFFEI